MSEPKDIKPDSGELRCSSLRLGQLQKLVLGLCTIHEEQTIAKIATELGRDASQIAKVVTRLEDMGLLYAMRPTSRNGIR